MAQGLLEELVLAYGVGVVVVLLLLRLKVPTVVGFLLAGVLLGPHGLRLVRDVEAVSALADIGVVILLFTIGVEMSIGRILRMGATLLAACALQLGLTTAGVALPVWATGTAPGPAVVLGLLVAASSTTLVLRVLADRGETEAPQGRLALGVAILQDLAVVPVMMLLPVLAGAGGGAADTAATVGKALAVVAGTVVLARTVVPRVLELVVDTRSRELFALTVIFLCLGTAWAASAAGLSLALGAFLGGLVVSESPYSQQVLGEMAPIRDGLSGLFFIGVGMLLDLGAVVAAPGPVVGAVAAILLAKTLLAAVASLVAGYRLRTAVLAGAALAQVGEFSFVLAREASRLSLLSSREEQLFLASAVLTMVASPFLYRLAPGVADALDRRLGHRWRGRGDEEGGVTAHAGHVVVVGFGLTGRNVARALGHHGLDFVAVEMNPETVRRERAAGVAILYGDAGHPDVLRHAGLDGARLVVLAISDLPGTKRVLATVKSLRPDVRTIVRARYAREVGEYVALGADEVVPDEVETSVEIFARVLRAYDLTSEAIERSVRAVREEGFEAVRSTAARHGVSPSRVQRVGAVDLETHVLGPGAVADGKTIGELEVRKRHGVTVVAVRREGELLPEPGAATRLAAADVVVLMGTPDRLSAAAELFKARGPAATSAGAEVTDA